MITAEKPPLDDDLLIHFGIPGMKWGRRKARDTSGSSRTSRVASRAASSMGESAKQNKKAVAVLGVVAVGSVLYATGNLKAASIGGSKLAFRGAKVATRLLVKMGGFTLRTAGKVAVSTVKTTVNTGKVVVGASYNKAFPPDPPSSFSKWRSEGASIVKGNIGQRKTKIASALSSKSSALSSKSSAVGTKFRERGRKSVQSLLSRKTKLKDALANRQPTKLYPVEPIWRRKA